jgi:hypothetical protein
VVRESRGFFVSLRLDRKPAQEIGAFINGTGGDRLGGP